VVPVVVSAPLTAEAINGRGGAIFFKADTTYSGLPYQVTIYNTSFQENTADKGGGVNINNWGYFPLIIDVTIDNCEFNSNEALGGNGGGLSSVNSNVTITDCDFSGNQANDGSGGGVFVADYDSLLVLDVLIDNCEFINNAADNYAGLRIKGYVFTLSNSVFTGNTAVRFTAGGGFTAGSSGTVSNCLFASNIANTGGEYWNSGGVSVWGWANVDFMNCTFADNSAYYGTGLTVGGRGIATITNCIFWGNNTDQIALDTVYGVGGTLTVNYCDVQDGENSVNVIDPLLSTLNWGIGNKDENPLFVGTGDYPYTLLSGSPCIDAGDPNPIYNDPEDPNNPGYALWPAMGTVRNDMGAYGGPGAIIVGIEDDETKELQPPTEFELTQNYPNPFNPTTTIKYQIPELSFVTVKVYDVLGNEVAILANEEKPIGSYEVDFNASALSSGVYFYRLQAGSFVETKKMILLK